MSSAWKDRRSPDGYAPLMPAPSSCVSSLVWLALSRWSWVGHRVIRARARVPISVASGSSRRWLPSRACHSRLPGHCCSGGGGGAVEPASSSPSRQAGQRRRSGGHLQSVGAPAQNSQNRRRAGSSGVNIEPGVNAPSITAQFSAVVDTWRTVRGHARICRVEGGDARPHLPL